MLKYIFLLILVTTNSFADNERKIEIEYQRYPSKKLEEDLQIQQTNILNKIEKQKLLIEAIDNFFKQKDLERNVNKEKQLIKQENQ